MPDLRLDIRRIDITRQPVDPRLVRRQQAQPQVGIQPFEIGLPARGRRIALPNLETGRRLTDEAGFARRRHGSLRPRDGRRFGRRRSRRWRRHHTGRLGNGKRRRCRDNARKNERTRLHRQYTTSGSAARAKQRSAKQELSLHTSTEVLLVSGIANPLPLKKYLQDATKTYYEILYGDHHIFRIDDWNEIVKRFNNIPAENKIILTTEKDAVRLIKFGQTLQDYPIYVIPIEIQFLFNEGHQFTDIISKFITDFSITN